MTLTIQQLKQQRNLAFQMGEMCRAAGQHHRAKQLFAKGKKLKAQIAEAEA